MLKEILEIPEKADKIALANVTPLPLNVPYLAMGSSYFAALAFKYMAIPIYPELASEYFYYLAGKEKLPLAVILSQSGRSSEALWCRDLFEKYIAITNYPENALANAGHVQEVLHLEAGPEEASSSKTYTNTLIVLFKGFGYNVSQSVDLLKTFMPQYQETGHSLANQIFDLITTGKIQGIYVIGSGPNIATALQAALILSESTKLVFTGLPMAQYDHGPKETAKNSIVIHILSKGPAYQRAVKLNETVTKAGAHVFTVENPAVSEHFSILHNIVPLNFLAYYLAQKLKVSETFTVGGKVTEV